MRFAIDFHGPFRVTTGQAGRGADITVDPTSPLAGSSLKGVMRAAAHQLLPNQAGLIGRVYGTPRTPSPWHWSSAQLDQLAVRRRTRIKIDPDRHTTVTGALVVAEELWATNASFTIEPLTPPDDPQAHELVLLASAHGVHALGSDRRRGCGWVSLRGTDPTLDDQRLAAFLELRSVHV
jgi:CRISPR/Cas system CSM-associated protein Csm3 (group 7 of RAMP superfamily)